MMDKLWYIYTMECYSGMKSNELMIQIIDTQQHEHISKALCWVKAVSSKGYRLCDCSGDILQETELQGWTIDQCLLGIWGWG